MRSKLTPLSALAAALVLSPAAALAQGEAEPAQPERMSEAEATEKARQQGLIRVSETLNATVRDQDGNKLATIQEVAIDSNHQQAAYALISSGGFLGLGDKQVVVPFTTLEAAPGEDGLRATFGEATIEQAAEFEAGNWHSLTQKEKAKQVHDQFGVEGYWTGPAAPDPGDAGQAPIEGQQPGAAQPGVGQGEAQRGDQQERRMTELQILAASELMDQPITSAAGQPQQRGQEGAAGQAQPGEEPQPGEGEADPGQGQGQELGQLTDLIVDMREGKLVYAIISRTDAVAESQYAAVPFRALQYDPDQQQFTLDTEPQALSELAFGEDNWPDMTSEQWASRVHQAFNQQPYWQVFGYASPGQDQGQGQGQGQGPEQGQPGEGQGAQPEERGTQPEQR